MLRAYTREPIRSDIRSEQTHDDCEWLNEKDGEQNVLGSVRCRDGRISSPVVAEDERWDARRKNDTGSENRERDREYERRC
jgi:hypothetical protein